MTKILIVENEGPNVEILTRLLKRNQFEIAVANNGRDAVAMAKSERPDLILMDIGIPNCEGEPENRLGGVEATQQIRLAADTKHIPIIALTASTMPDDKKRFLEAGCDAVQAKPFMFPELIAAINDRLKVNAVG